MNEKDIAEIKHFSDQIQAFIIELKKLDGDCYVPIKRLESAREVLDQFSDKELERLRREEKQKTFDEKRKK